MATAKKSLLVRARNAGRRFYTRFVPLYYNTVWGMHIDPTSIVARTVKLDKTNPGGVHIGAYCIVTFDTVILTHDFVNLRHVDTRIGNYCFIGCRTVIAPGVTIGDYVIIGANSTVTSDIPSRSVAVGSPARVVRSDMDTRRYWWIPAEAREAFPVTATPDPAAT